MPTGSSGPSRAHDQDLFWALRGGGGDFGIVTAMEIRLLPGFHLYGGRLLWPSRRCPRCCAPSARSPRRLPTSSPSGTTPTSSRRCPRSPRRSAARPSPPSRWRTWARRRRRRSCSRRSVPSMALVMDLMGPVRMADLGGIADEPVDPMPSMEHSMLLDDLSDQLIERLTCVAGENSGSPWPSSRSGTSAGPSGVTTTPTASATPSTSPTCCSRWACRRCRSSRPRSRPRSTGWTWPTEGHTNGRTVPNFLGADGDLDRAWYPATRTRLAQVKSRRGPAPHHPEQPARPGVSARAAGAVDWTTAPAGAGEADIAVRVRPNLRPWKGAVVVEVQVDVLGPLRVRVDGAEQRLGGRRDRAVLALLASNGGNPVSAERLVDEVWGEAAPSSATGSLQVAVSKLRGVLDPDRTGSSGAPLLQRGPSGYHLQGVALDAHAFSEAANTVGTVAPEDALRTVDEALASWRGQPYADLADVPSLAAEATRLAEDRLRLLEARADALLRLDRPDEAQAMLAPLVERAPVPRAAVVTAGTGPLPLRPTGRGARDGADAAHPAGRGARRRPLRLGASARGGHARPGAAPRVRTGGVRQRRRGVAAAEPTSRLRRRACRPWSDAPPSWRCWTGRWPTWPTGVAGECCC